MNMGFVEMPTNRWVESSFWNFDALFQPQSHPARDAHDTFFVKEPASTLTVRGVYMCRWVLMRRRARLVACYQCRRSPDVKLLSHICTILYRCLKTIMNESRRCMKLEVMVQLDMVATFSALKLSRISFEHIPQPCRRACCIGMSQL